MRVEASCVEEDGVAADRQHDGDVPLREQLAEVAHLAHAGAHVLVLDGLLDADGEGLHVAAGHAAVGVQALVDHDEVAQLLEDVSSLTASQPPMLTRWSFLADIQAPSV